ncbi:MAG: sigma-54-dependent Fis family transcriptional regulator [Alphaproteobacteria bacterium]|nr:MAG: sigma-54-dependent Fis family transcriptional regulator [Alphaproteobacteria bacterium]
MLEGRRIAVVEDDEIMGTSLVQRLELEGAEVIWLRQIVRAVGALRSPRAPIDAVVCDIRLPDGTGEELFTTLLQTASPPPFLFITGHGGIEQAVRLMKAGAADYVTKPFEMSVFLERISLLLSNREEEVALPPLLGISPQARQVDAQAAEAATHGRPVLIRGGPGVGKGLVARRIHALSDRRAAPFVAVNLAREPDHEAALFGPAGALARTGEGVLFLHAVSRMAGAVQERLLAALDAGFEGRVIAACGIDLQGAVARRGFSPDLFYFLAGVEIAIPPLDERPEDAVWLMHRVFERANAERAEPLAGISRLAEEAVRGHSWPGGGRELRARVTSGVRTARGDRLQPSDLFPERVAEGDHFPSLAEARERAERRLIIEALERAGGQTTRAARLLKVSRTTLWEKMQRLGIAAAED